MKMYVVVLIRSASLRRFERAPTTYFIFSNKQTKNLDTPDLELCIGEGCGFAFLPNFIFFLHRFSSPEV